MLAACVYLGVFLCDLIERERGVRRVCFLYIGVCVCM